MANKTDKAIAIHRVSGRLHAIEEVRDEVSKAITRIASPLQVELLREDLAQLFAGALMLGAPIALTEEVWTLGVTLSPGRILLIAVVSFLINSLLVKLLFYPDNLPDYRYEFFKRVIASYVIALTAALLLLVLFDKGLIDDPALALKRAVIIALPASFAATVVDSIR
jgi:uncharacterized membrane protein